MRQVCRASACVASSGMRGLERHAGAQATNGSWGEATSEIAAKLASGGIPSSASVASSGMGKDWRVG